MTALYRKKIGIIASLHLLLVCSHYASAQVVTNMNEGTIQGFNTESEEPFASWDMTMKDFKEEETEAEEKSIEKTLEKELKETPGAFNEISHNGKSYRLPSVIDENGIDLYLLSEEGIQIYLAFNSPAYYQEFDKDIVKWIRYFAYTNRAKTERIFKRYEKWEPLIKQYFEMAGLPAELSAICLIESGCTYNALSSAGAAGMWQIMPETARQFGLKVNYEIDERTDPVLSCQAAAKILLANYKKTNDWALAVASYNCGAGRILSTKGQTFSIKKSNLPKETQQYIPSIIAIQYCWNNKTKLGF